MNYCPCGRINNTSISDGYLVTIYNEKGEIVYAVCCHGNVVVNKENEENDLS